MHHALSFVLVLAAGLTACPDNGGGTHTPASSNVIETSDAPSSDDADVAAGCPEEPTDAACSFSRTCSYGTECCCGQCYPSQICSCENGLTVCFYTHACLIPSCGDVTHDADGIVDAADQAPDVPTPDVPPPDVPTVDDGGGPLNDADTGTGQCPAEDAIDFGASCDFSETCRYGTECCCGECYDSLVCECIGGATACYYTDACSIPACPDAAVSDVVSDAINPGDAGPDAGGLGEGQCETEADCDSTIFALCWAPDEQLPCGVCFSPPETCADDSACKAIDPTTICKTEKCACSGEKTCQQGCLDQDSNCGPGQTCATDGNCVATSCSSASDCPTNFQCGQAGTCERKPCSDSATCTGYCVKGLCYDDPGYCSPAPS